jgi:hypothetical protein
MADRLSDTDHHVLEAYIRVVLERCKSGTSTIVEAQEDIMHPLKALLNHDGGQEFIPYMKMKLHEWKE